MTRSLFLFQQLWWRSNAEGDIPGDAERDGSARYLAGDMQAGGGWCPRTNVANRRPAVRLNAVATADGPDSPAIACGRPRAFSFVRRDDSRVGAASETMLDVRDRVWGQPALPSMPERPVRTGKS